MRAAAVASRSMRGGGGTAAVCSLLLCCCFGTRCARGGLCGCTRTAVLPEAMGARRYTRIRRCPRPTGRGRDIPLQAVETARRSSSPTNSTS